MKIIHGEQIEATKMLQEHPWLFFAKGNVTDYSGREFNNVSGFQYALWAYDTHMWRMMLNVFNKPNKQKDLNPDSLKRITTLKTDALEFAKKELKDLEEDGIAYSIAIEPIKIEQKEKDEKTNREEAEKQKKIAAELAATFAKMSKAMVI